MKSFPDFIPGRRPKDSSARHAAARLAPQRKAALVSLLDRGLGLAPTDHQIEAFIHACRSRAATLGLSEEVYLKLLELGGAEAGGEWSAIAPAVVVGETYFFRDPDLWRLFELQLLPSLRHLAGPLWIWSAGCATGEEAYTVAILARRVLGQNAVRILATDVNPKAITAARAGVYGRWSLRGVDMPWLDGAIATGHQAMRVSDDTKSMVRFELHNLTDAGAYPPAGMTAFECIVCRNVLIYMTPDARARILSRFTELLTPGGLLILGHGEATVVELPGLRAERYEEGVVFRKPLIGAIEKAGRKVAPPARGAPKSRGSVPDVPKVTSRRHAGAKSSQPKTDQTVDAQRAAAPTPSAYRDAVALNEAALAEARRGDMKAAERGATKAIAVDPLNPLPHVLLGAVYAERGDLRRAERELRSALFLDPTHIPALWQIGTLYRLTDRERQARFAFARALTGLEGRPPDEQVLPLDSMTVAELEAVLRAELGEGAQA